MPAQLPPPQPGPGGTWFPVLRPDGTPGWDWVPDPAAANPGNPPPPPPPPGGAPEPAPPVPPAPEPGRPPNRLRTLYLSGLAVAVLAAWGAMFVLDRSGDEPGPAVAVTVTPTSTPDRKPSTPAERALADNEGVVVDDKGDGTVIVTLGVPAGSRDERAAEVARETYDVLQALADADVEFEVLVVRGTTSAAEGPPEPAAPEVYKASFSSKAVYGIDFEDVDRASLDDLREASVNNNLLLEDSG